MTNEERQVKLLSVGHQLERLRRERAEAICEANHVDYYIKDSLRAEMNKKDGEK